MDISQLKKAKNDLGLTFEELSIKCGVPIQTLHNIFRGHTKNPRIDTMQAIEEALGLSKPLEWTEDDIEAGVGRHPTYLSEEEYEWLELRSEVIRTQGEDYLRTLKIMIEAVIKQKKMK